MTTHQPGNEPSPGRKRVRRPYATNFFLLLVVGLLIAATGEIVTRLLTTTTLGAMPQIRGVPLLPYRPSEEFVRNWLGTRAERERRERIFVVSDPKLGWTVGPNGHTGMNYSNSQGVRTHPQRVFSADTPPGKLRLVLVGDSFTQGDQLPFEKTWAAMLEDHQPRFEVINLGVSGYGTDQAFLRWRKDGKQFESDFVVLGIWPEDICRNLNMNRYLHVPFAVYAAKPSFAIEGSELKLRSASLPVPEEMIRALSRPEESTLYNEDYWFSLRYQTPRFYYRSRALCFALSVKARRQRSAMAMRLYSNEDPVGNELTVAIAKRFSDEVSSTGSTPIIMIFPMRELMELYPDADSLPLAKMLRSEGLDVLNLFPRFVEEDGLEGVASLFLPSGHLSRRGNRIVATELEKYLNARHPLLLAVTDNSEAALDE